MRQLYKHFLVLSPFVCFVPILYAQTNQADIHRQTAASYRQAAAQASGTQKECYLRWANYEDCQASRFASGSSSSCVRPSCSFSSSASSSSGNEEPSSVTTNSGTSSLNDAFDALRNTITDIFKSRREREERREQAEREAKEARDNEAIEQIERSREKSKATWDSVEEDEEDERAKERERFYKEQRAKERAEREKNNFVSQSQTCGWRGLAWFSDKDYVPELSELRAQNPSRVVYGDGWLILKIVTVSKDGKITGVINARPFTGSINPKREIQIVSGTPTVDYDEFFGEFSTDGRIIKGKWRNTSTNKISRGVFALEAECNNK
jgi:hypothetical protein